jgi:TPR repeat protein
MAGVTAALAPGADGTRQLVYDYTDEGTRLRHLRCRAANGSAEAALELGIRYEEGRGVVRDFARAAALYRAAANPVPGLTVLYTPSPRIHGRGAVIRVGSEDESAASAEAERRLGFMYKDGRGVPRDLSKARNLLENAAQAGDQVARRTLETSD